MSDQISSGLSSLGSSNAAQIIVPLAMGAAAFAAPRAAHGIIGGMEMMQRMGEKSRRQEAVTGIADLVRASEASGKPVSQADILAASKGAPEIGLHAASMLHREPRLMSGPGGAAYNVVKGPGGELTLKQLMPGRDKIDLAATELGMGSDWASDPAKVKQVQEYVTQRDLAEGIAKARATGDIHYQQQEKYAPGIAASTAAAVEPAQTQGAVNRAQALAPAEMDLFKKKQAITAESRETGLSAAIAMQNLATKVQKEIDDIQAKSGDLVQGVPGSIPQAEATKRIGELTRRVKGLNDRAAVLFEKHGGGAKDEVLTPASSDVTPSPTSKSERVLVPNAKTKNGGPVYQDNSGKYWSTAK
jgi:hypothetical protein